MASEFRRRTLLTWSVFGAGFYGLKRAFRDERSEADEGAAMRGKLWHAQPINSFALSPDGTMFATGSRPLSDRLSDDSEGVVCWQVSDGQARWKARLPGGVLPMEEPFTALRFSPDGTLLAAATRQNTVVSIEVSGSARVGSQRLWATEKAPRFFFSHDGLQLFIASTAQPGQLGHVFASRSGVSVTEWTARLDERDAVPFGLDQRGLHLVSKDRYLIVPQQGEPVQVAEVLPPGPVLDVVVTPSGAHAAALGINGAVGRIDVALGEVELRAESPGSSLNLPLRSGVPFAIQRASAEVWSAYALFPEQTPLISGKYAEEPVPNGQPFAASPDGNRAVTVFDEGEVTLVDLSTHQRESLGTFPTASAVAFPTDDRVVVFGPTVLAFIDLTTRRPIARYLFPRY